MYKQLGWHGHTGALFFYTAPLPPRKQGRAEAAGRIPFNAEEVTLTFWYTLQHLFSNFLLYPRVPPALCVAGKSRSSLLTTDSVTNASLPSETLKLLLKDNEIGGRSCSARDISAPGLLIRRCRRAPSTWTATSEVCTSPGSTHKKTYFPKRIWLGQTNAAACALFFSFPALSKKFSSSV